jgi:hypothetical protein
VFELAYDLIGQSEEAEKFLYLPFSLPFKITKLGLKSQYENNVEKGEL